MIAAGICSQFADAQFVRDNPDVEKQCSGNVIGPGSPGIHDPDPGKRPSGSKAAAKRRRGRDLDPALAAQARSSRAEPVEEPALDYLLGP